jgi:hypothetical protein
MSFISEPSSLASKWESIQKIKESTELQIYSDRCSSENIVNNLASIISTVSPMWEPVQEYKKGITLQIDPDPCSPESIVNNLASIEGATDVYFWYEGSQCLPELGANFMKKSFFEPLYKLKQDAKLCLYSLAAWNFKKNITSMPSSTDLGEAINCINKTAIECIYSSSFFQFCSNIQKEESGLYEFLNKKLPKKEWLFNLSKNQREKGTTVSEWFNEQTSLFDCIKDLDLSAAYSSMQYVEGYYLIRESVKKGLLNGQKKIQIAFVLPNDESKYYLDYPKDIKKMLRADFGNDLSDIDINISFQFFQYGDSPTSRPYIDKRRKAPKVKKEDIGSYFDYLLQPSFSRAQPNRPFCRDVIHNINGWY